MTSPIKPPGGPKAPDASAPGASEGLRPSGETFADALDASRAEAAATTVAPVLGADAASVVDRLVAEQLEGPLAAGLDAAGRKALEAHLRATLEDDPGFRALVEDAAGDP